MSHIYIYGDESGVMPLKDHEAFFCVATVCFDDKRPEIYRGSDERYQGSEARLPGELKKNGAAVLVTFVKPKPDYGLAIENRFELMDTMARMTRLLGGANAKYLEPEGLPSTRNHIYTFCMIQAISHTIGFATSRGPVSGVSALLDRKTLSKQQQRLLRDQVGRAPGVLQRVMDDPTAPDPRAARIIRTRLQTISPDAISLSWSDDPGNDLAWMKDGLTLADQVASRIRRDAINPPESPLASELDAEGVHFQSVDLTDHLIADLSPEAVEQWEQQTGLKAPRPERERA